MSNIKETHEQQTNGTCITNSTTSTTTHNATEETAYLETYAHYTVGCCYYRGWFAVVVDAKSTDYNGHKSTSYEIKHTETHAGEASN